MAPEAAEEWTGDLAGAGLDLDIDDDALARLLAPGGAAPAAAIDLAPSDELRDVTRRISAQFLDVLHVTASSLFAGRDPRGAAAQLLTALDALLRLASAAQDTTHEALLHEIRPLAEAFAGDPRGRSRDRFLAKLRAWLVRYAEHLGEEEGARFRALVAYDAREVPLFAELAAIPGIGPRRLDRLFCAGLYAVEVVGAADPIEVAQVTGLPRALAADVVSRARSFQDEHRRRTVVEMRARLTEFQRVLGAIDPSVNADLWAIARSAVQEMQTMVNHLQAPEEAGR